MSPECIVKFDPYFTNILNFRPFVSSETWLKSSLKGSSNALKGNYFVPSSMLLKVEEGSTKYSRSMKVLFLIAIFNTSAIFEYPVIQSWIRRLY